MPTIIVESGSPSDSVASNGDDAEKGAHCNGDLLGPSAALSPEHADTGEDSEAEEVSGTIRMHTTEQHFTKVSATPGC